MRNRTHTDGSVVAIARIADRQHGVFSAEQACQHLSRFAVARRVREGHWERIHPSVYRIRGAASSWKQALSAALLWAGKDAVVSYRAAGVLWRLDQMERDAIELLVPYRRSLHTTLTVHRSRDLSSKDVTRRAGFPVTTLVRTMIDLASVLDRDRLEIALDSAIRNGLDIPWLWKRIGSLGGRGRRGMATLANLLKERHRGSENLDSVLERKLLQLLRRSKLPEPVHHFDVCDGPLHVAEVDFAYPKQRIAIEADGYQSHGGRAAWDRDSDRATRLAVLGWRVLHVTWKDLETRPSEMVDRIRQTLDRPPVPE